MTIDNTFDELVIAMYGHIVPARGYDVVEDGTEFWPHFARTGFVPVVELTDDELPISAKTETYYKLMAWINYRAMQAEKPGSTSTFEQLVADVMKYNKWSNDTARWLTILDGLVNVQKEYEQRFKHLPVDLSKFIKSYIKSGRKAVLRSDIY